MDIRLFPIQQFESS